MKTIIPSRNLKKKIYLGLFSIFLLLIMIYPMLDTFKNHEMAIPIDLTEPKIPKLISSGDGTTSYRASYKWVEYGDFNSFGNWTEESGSNSDVTLNGGYAEFIVSGSMSDFNNRPRLVLSPEPFFYGNLTISWYCSGMESGETLEIRYRYYGEAWNSYAAIASISYTQTSEIQTTIEFSHTQYQCYNPNFQIAIILNANKFLDGDNDLGFVNWIRLYTWEFQISESNDIIPQQTSQVINTYVYPYNNATPIDKVYINYAKTSNLANPSRVFCTLSGSYYTGTIPDSYYDYNDNVYYQICYNLTTSGIEVKSHTSNYPYFNATDTTDPSFSAPTFDPSTPNYNQSTLFSITCSEISGDSGLNSLVMYLKNSSGVTTSDYSLIPNEPLTDQGGVFTFSISDSILKYNRLYYFLRAIDKSGRVKDYPETYLTIADNYSPQYIEDPVNTNDQNYLNDKIVYIDIWEPDDASGLNLTSIKIKYGTDPALISGTTEVSYSSKVGNKFGFTIPFLAFPAQGQYMYYNVSGKDNASNQFSTSIRSFMIKDLEPPTLSLYTQGSNHTNHPYYYQNVNMTFTTSDVIGGVGLNDIRLYVNNGSSPLTNWGACINVSDTKTQTASNNYSFIIESVHLSAREDLY